MNTSSKFKVVNNFSILFSDSGIINEVNDLLTINWTADLGVLSTK
jgi:hypothetical protein